MIFVAVGTQLPFDRLVRAIDDWAGRSGAPAVVAQTGRTAGVFRHISAEAFIDPRRFAALQREAELLVGHAGMGTILGAMEIGKPLIIMPRRAALGEHRNDHQLATARHFCGKPGIHVAMDECELAQLLERRAALAAPEGGLAAAASPELIGTLRRFIGSSAGADGH